MDSLNNIFRLDISLSLSIAEALQASLFSLIHTVSSLGVSFQLCFSSLGAILRIKFAIVFVFLFSLWVFFSLSQCGWLRLA